MSDTEERSTNDNREDNLVPPRLSMNNQTAPPAVTFVQGFQGTIRPFDPQDVTTWFQHFESILRIHHIADEDKYDHLMAVLTKNAVAPISMQLKKPPVDAAARYPWLKDLLTEGHGKSNRERLRQLLAGEKIGDRRPSQFLSRLHELAPEGVDEDIIREMWWKELPSAARAILTTMQTASAHELAQVADAVHAEMNNAQIHAIRAPPPQLDELRELRLMMERMGDELFDLRHQIKQMNQSRRQSRQYRDDSSQRKTSEQRSRSGSRQRHAPRPTAPPTAPATDEECYYHQQYKDQARNCRPPCKYSKN